MSDIIIIAKELSEIIDSYDGDKKYEEVIERIRSLRNKLTTEYLSDNEKVVFEQGSERIIIGWDCPVCINANVYEGGLDNGGYYDQCAMCELGVELVPE